MPELILPAIVLQPGREKSLQRRHPWIFSGAVARVLGQPQSGDTVQVYSQAQALLGRGGYSPQSQIRVRMWTYAPETLVDAAWWQQQIQQAIQARQPLLSQTNACRLIAAESDGLPGVIVDRYGDVLVCQLLSAGAEAWRETLVQSLAQAFPGASIFERSDADVRSKEGLSAQVGLLAGPVLPEQVKISETQSQFKSQFWVDVRQGHKTGFYLDQRTNRATIAELARGKDVLNCFAYTGGFSVAALQAGATQVTNVESSATAIALSEQNHQLNQIDPNRYKQIEGDVFQVLRQQRDCRASFDLIILDPPKFADTQAQIAKAARGYKDINRLAMLLLRPGGVLVTFSCSGLLSPELFQKIVADAALDAHRPAQILQRLSQASDHPTLLSVPESSYLKGFVCRVL